MLKSIILMVVSFNIVESFNDEGAMDVAAFNLKHFDMTDLDKNNVRTYLPRIILQFDLIFLQGVKEIHAITELLKLVNEENKKKYYYNATSSPILGKTKCNQEYFVFLYRTDWLYPITKSVYADTLGVFERNPFIVQFGSDFSVIPKFVVVGLRTLPEKAVVEIDGLADVYKGVMNSLKIDDVIIMGDFNAGGNYVESNDWKNIKLAKEKHFYWLISNRADTTVAGLNYPYDRIVIAGSKMIKAIIPRSPDVFLFDEEYALSKDCAKDISERYPVFMQIKSKNEADYMEETATIAVLDQRNHLTKFDVIIMRKKAIELKYHVSTMYKKGGDLEETVIAIKTSGRDGVEDAINKILKDFRTYFAVKYNDALIRIFKNMDILQCLPRGRQKYQTLYDIYKSEELQYLVQVRCNLIEPVECWYEIKKIYT